MTRAPINFSKLSAADQESLRGVVGVAPLDKQPTAARSAAGRKRQATGRAFESELDMFHAYLEHQKLGKIRRNWVPTRVVGKGRRVPYGAAHVDRTGWVKIASDDFYEVIPVAFDAKVLDMEHSTYQHAKELQHQIHDLREAANAGECAFLLILAPKVDRMYALPIGKHFDALLRGDGVTLFRSGAHFGADEFPRSVVRDPDTNLWNWIPLVEYSAP